MEEDLLGHGLIEKYEDPDLFERYRGIILVTIDETLENILGKTIKEIVYAYMHHEYRLDKVSYYKDLDKFIKALRDIIGINASMLVENIVVKRLCNNLGLDDVDAGVSLQSFLEKLKDSKPKKTRLETTTCSHQTNADSKIR